MLGQVCCDGNGKLNAQSVLLEASQEHGARQVPVEVSELKDYSLFPGQVSRNVHQYSHTSHKGGLRLQDSVAQFRALEEC